MPEYIGNEHDIFIKRILREGRTKIIKKYRSAVGKSKNGYIFPI
jgi:hypothetical protein